MCEKGLGKTVETRAKIEVTYTRYPFLAETFFWPNDGGGGGFLDPNWSDITFQSIYKKKSPYVYLGHGTVHRVALFVFIQIRFWG